MQESTNFGLALFDGADPISRLVFNQNWNRLDEVIKTQRTEVDGVLAEHQDEINNLWTDVRTNFWDGTNMWRYYKWLTQNKATTYQYTSSAVIGGANYSTQGGYNIQYADKYTVATDGTVSLVNPTTKDWIADGTIPDILNLKGKYIRLQDVTKSYFTGVSEPSITRGQWGNVLYVTSSVSRQSGSYSDPSRGDSWSEVTYSGLEELISYEGLAGVAVSPDANAYPADGWVGDIHYVKAPAATRIKPVVELGSYIGTGGSGSTNPTRIPSGVKIYAVFIQPVTGGEHMMLTRGVTAPGNKQGTVSWSDYDVSIVCNSAADQMNTSGVTYNYMVIGLAV